MGGGDGWAGVRPVRRSSSESLQVYIKKNGSKGEKKVRVRAREKKGKKVKDK